MSHSDQTSKEEECLLFIARAYQAIIPEGLKCTCPSCVLAFPETQPASEEKTRGSVSAWAAPPSDSTTVVEEQKEAVVKKQEAEEIPAGSISAWAAP